MSRLHPLRGTVLTVGLSVGLLATPAALGQIQHQQQQQQPGDEWPRLPWLAQEQQRQQQQRTPPNADVEQALLSAYPGDDARIRVTGVRTINGVQVYDATVTTDEGEATARLTEHGDFLAQGQPRPADELAEMVRQNVQALFGDAPRDVTLSRSTSYAVDIPVPGQQWQGSESVYRARFDATGRLLDVQNPGEVLGEYQRLATRSVSDRALADRITELARPHIGQDAEIHAVYEGPAEGWYFVDVAGAGAYAILNEQGEVLSARRQVDGWGLPVPVRDAVNQTFSNAVRAYAGEELTYEFTRQQQQQGQAEGAVVIRLRPDGHVLGVVKEPAADAQTAGAAQEPRIDWRREEPRPQQQQEQQQDDVDQRISTPRGGVEWQ